MAIINVRRETLPDSDCIPKGEYHLQIESVNDPKQDKKGQDFIALGLQVADGPQSGRFVFDNYVPLNGAKMKSMLDSSDYKGDVADTNDLIGAIVHAFVVIEEPDEEGVAAGYVPQNRIKHYIPKK